MIGVFVERSFLRSYRRSLAASDCQTSEFEFERVSDRVGRIAVTLSAAAALPVTMGLSHSGFDRSQSGKL